MRKNKHEIFLLFTIVFLLVGLSTINATENSEIANNTDLHLTKDTTTDSEAIKNIDQTIKSYNNKNNSVTKHKTTDIKNNEEKVDTSLGLKFIIDDNDEYSSDNFLVTHIDDNYTIDITLKENQNDLPISGLIQLYHDDDELPMDIQINSTGHNQITFTTNNLGSSVIYAYYGGNEKYNPQTSDILEIETEQYETTLTLDDIDNININSTINITGRLCYDDNKPLINETIIVSVNNQFITETITNSAGEYSINYTINDDVQDMLKITVEYISSTDKYDDSYNETLFDIEKIQNFISLNSIQNLVVGTPELFSGVVYDENNNKYNGLMKVLITDKESEQLFINDTINIHDSNFEYVFIPKKAGIYEISLIIDENDYFTGTYQKTIFEVEPAILVLSVEDFYESLVMDNVSITGHILNENNDPLSNITVLIKTESNELGSCITDVDGKFLFTQYKFMEIGEDDFFELYFIVDETEDHDFLFEESYYLLSRRNFNISVTGNESIKINQKIEVEGKVVDSYDNTIIPEGTVTLYINDEEVANDIQLDKNGCYNTKISITEKYLNHDELIIEARFVLQNNRIYNEENFDSIITIVDSTKTSITIQSSNTTVNAKTNITIKLSDEYSNNLNETVTLTIRNNDSRLLNEDIMLENGTKTVSFTPTSEGIYILYVEYKGLNNIYTSSYDEYQIVVQKIPSKISLEKINVMVYVNDTINIEGLLTDSHNITLQDEIALEIITGENIIQKNITTDANGKFFSTFIPYKQENITIRLVYAGNDVYYENYTQKIIEVIKHDTTLNIDSLPETIKYTDNIIIRGQVLEKYNNDIVNGTITIKINSHEISDITLSNGTFIYEYKVKEFGQNNILQVIFNENNVFKVSEKEIVLNVEALNSKISVNSNFNSTINNRIIINGTLKDEKNNYINGNLTITVDNETINNKVTATNGTFLFEYTPIRSGLLLMNISFEGDNLKYKATTNLTKLNIQKSQITIENLEIIPIKENFTIQIKGELTNQDNLDNSNINILITINDTEYDVITDENGSFILTAKTIPSNYTIGIHIDETEKFNNFDYFELINLTKDTPFIYINEISNVTYDIPVNITGIITDSYNQPLNNITLTICVSDNMYITTTDSEGKYIQEINNFSAGTNYITITTDETIYYNTASTIETFEVNRQEVILAIYENNNTIPGESFIIKGHLKDKTGNILADKLVTISVNNKKYYVQTDKEGEFYISINNSKVGAYNINVSFNDSNYLPTSNNKTITISKIKVHLSVQEIVSFVGEKIILKANLIDEFGNKVNGGNLVFKINGRTLRMDDRFDSNNKDSHKFIVENGTVEYSIMADLYLKNAKNISATYSGSYKYESAKSDISLASIKLREAVLNIQTNNSKFKQHENINITVKIEDITSNNTKLLGNDSFVIFKLNGITLRDDENKTIVAQVINNTASYVYNVGVISSVDANNNLRDYNITAVYVNSNHYPNVINSTIYHVEKSLTDIQIDSVILKDSNLNIQANIVDYLGQNVIGNNKICVKINGVTYKENNITKYYNITDGKINLTNLDIGDNKIKSIEIVSGERQAYLPIRKTVQDIIIEE